MVDLDRLEARARRAAERGRLRMASRVALAVAPLTCVAVLAGGAPGVSACLGCVLLLGAVGLRHWHEAGVTAVRLGLAMGVVPLVATVLLRACGVDCAPLTRLGEGEIVCLLAGVLAGAGVTLRASAEDRASFRTWALATGVAAATAALGCGALGAGGVLVTVSALVAASGLAMVPLRTRFA